MPNGPIQRWRDTLAVYASTDAEAAEIRARHLASVMRLTPAMVAANVANGVWSSGRCTNSPAPGRGCGCGWRRW